MLDGAFKVKNGEYSSSLELPEILLEHKACMDNIECKCTCHRKYISNHPGSENAHQYPPSTYSYYNGQIYKEYVPEPVHPAALVHNPNVGYGRPQAPREYRYFQAK